MKYILLVLCVTYVLWCLRCLLSLKYPRLSREKELIDRGRWSEIDGEPLNASAIELDRRYAKDYERCVERVKKGEA